ncbi:MAG: hypothetical protein A2X47_03530 [Lentisphaerae bacterium GWF2_38_69]|nr:MAG: hypothetical protein A2X47_03530 [Lentisphaerae bacterium GWF2_38_69]
MKIRTLTYMFTIFITLLTIDVNAEGKGIEKTEKSEVSPIGIISALSVESAYLKSRMSDVEIKHIMGRDYYIGNLNGHHAIVAQVGIGVINAAVGTAILIYEFKPKAIIMTGVAGGTNKTDPGDIIIANQVTFYDLGSLDDKGNFKRMPSSTPSSEFSGSGVEHDPLFYKADKTLLDKAVKASKSAKFNILEYNNKKYNAKPVEGIITSTETFTEYPEKINAMIKETNCIAFDMECAGAAQVCYNQKIPFLTIKAISDDGDFDMFNALLEPSAKNAEILVYALISEQ